MIIKFMGMAFVLITTVLAGIYYGSLESFRAADLMELKKALAILRSEIEFARSPLSEALINIGRRVNKPIGAIFLRLEELTHVERGGDISEQWARSVRENAPSTYLNQEDKDQLISFGGTLGYLDAGLQLSGINILTEYINDSLKTLNASRFKNKRMFQTLGVLSGLIIIIVFV